ncbi:glycine cleavage system protein GcvH [Streptomyces rubiginosohelvolus]
MQIPAGLKYTDEHIWVAPVAEGKVRIGLTDVAQGQLGEILYVQCSQEAGSVVAAGQAMGEVESTESLRTIYAPVSGTVAEVNTEVVQSPDTVNVDPYGDGWIVDIDMSDASELDKLLDATAYMELTSAG